MYTGYQFSEVSRLAFLRAWTILSPSSTEVSGCVFIARTHQRARTSSSVRAQTEVTSRSWRTVRRHFLIRRRVLQVADLPSSSLEAKSRVSILLRDRGSPWLRRPCLAFSFRTCFGHGTARVSL